MKRLSIIFLCIAAFACAHRQSVESEQTKLVDAGPSQCPYLTKDNQSNTVLSWVRMVNDSITSLCYAITKDGLEFSAPVVIPKSSNIQPHAENLPKVVFKPSGEIIAVWGAASNSARNKYAGEVYYEQSFDRGKTWTQPKRLVTDTAGFDQRYFDVGVLKNGEVGITWLDNRKTSKEDGSALYFATTSGTNGFGTGHLISGPCCQCCRTKMYVDKRGDIHVIYRAILEGSVRDMVHVVSTDGGASFTKPERISADNWVLSACPHTGPSMAENKEGMHFAWYTGGVNRGCYYTRSTDNGKSYIMHDSVSAAGTHPQMTSMPDGKLLIVWDESEVKNGKVYSKLGLQLRDGEGKSRYKTYISAADGNAKFPVVAALNDNTSLVAYINNKGDQSYVTCQVVKLF
jgi:hypothetical protein